MCASCYVEVLSIRGECQVVIVPWEFGKPLKCAGVQDLEEFATLDGEIFAGSSQAGLLDRIVEIDVVDGFAGLEVFDGAVSGVF